ncbi:carbamate kinase [[Mycobacterium] appelbergii]|uniref:carbamate kinase n=1 Tax=[Mycobacterium] appelbergii TaxID=2939269 RepID=UPI0029390082|nr:carbamate kinase [Mycobacterium sp. 21AC1]
MRHAAMKRVALIAIGGNALVLDGEPGSIPRQQERAVQFAEQIAELIVEGWTVVVSHGNGPQVGFILRRGELIAPEATIEGLPDLPLWLAVADSQGGIGHIIATAIDSALHRRGLKARAAALITHAQVDADDPAFALPTKPIGSQMTMAVAQRRTAEEGWTVSETSPGVYRRVVASPRPQAILEAEHVRTLTAAGAVVIACGGGGVPVVRGESGWRSADAVIDKDRASAVLAATVGIEVLVLVTGVDQVYVGYGTPVQHALGRITAEEARKYLDAGEFPAGSMGPKVESALQFLDDGGTEAIITSLPLLREALAGTAGTHVVRQSMP